MNKFINPELLQAARLAEQLLEVVGNFCEDASIGISLETALQRAEARLDQIELEIG